MTQYHPEAFIDLTDDPEEAPQQVGPASPSSPDSDGEDPTAAGPASPSATDHAEPASPEPTPTPAIESAAELAEPSAPEPSESATLRPEVPRKQLARVRARGRVAVARIFFLKENYKTNKQIRVLMITYDVYLDHASFFCQREFFPIQESIV